MAGPGTGKTYTFKELLKTLESDNNLVLTFIRTLVEDLARSLDGLARVNTFHGYCKNLLFSHPAEGLRAGVDYYPPLLQVVSIDMNCLDSPNSVKAIERTFHDLNEDSPIMALALQIGNYYNAVAHVDAVYRVLTEMKAGRQAPQNFEQVVVDEYQDFNKLEVEFIGQLAVANRVLIAGDDDQALYSFKQASAEYLRDLHADESEYDVFQLPYCSRCTEPVIAATKVIIDKARDEGLLRGRVQKTYECFLPEKREDNETYPVVRHAHCSIQRNNQPYMGYYIREQVEAIPGEEIAESRKDGFPQSWLLGLTRS